MKTTYGAAMSGRLGKTWFAHSILFARSVQEAGGEGAVDQCNSSSHSVSRSDFDQMLLTCGSDEPWRSLRVCGAYVRATMGEVRAGILCGHRWCTT